MNRLLTFCFTIAVAIAPAAAHGCRAAPRHDLTLVQARMAGDFKTVVLADVTEISDPKNLRNWDVRWASRAQIVETIYGEPKDGSIEFKEPLIYSDCLLTHNLPTKIGERVVVYLKKDGSVRYAMPFEEAMRADLMVANHRSEASRTP